MKPTMRLYQTEEDWWRIREFLRQVFLLNGRRELSGSFSNFVWGSGFARNRASDYNLQHSMSKECVYVRPHSQISTDLYN